MVGISQVIQVMGAMIIFSLILLNMNRFILLNDMELVQSEYEQVAMATGQSIINEAQTLAFDESTAPDSNADTLTAPDKLGTDGEENRQDVDKPPYNDIDDFNGFTDSKLINNINYNLSVEVCYVQKSDMNNCYYGGTTEHKLMTVAVNNKYMDNPIRLQLVKSFY